MYALSTASFKLRDQLIGLVGSVSQRLGHILERTHLLADAERVRINRIASEIASLQSSILDAINSSAITTPKALSELYDLELGAIRTIEQIEGFLANVGVAQTFPHAPHPAYWAPPHSPPPPAQPQPIDRNAWAGHPAYPAAAPFPELRSTSMPSSTSRPCR